MRALLLLAGPLALGACATTSAAPSGPAADSCHAEPGKRFIGQRATAELGREMLAATDAREIRWVPPDTMITMEYKFGRLTVGYDRAMLITSVACS